MLTETVFIVPRLNSASVAGSSCCPVPAEALILPELEAVKGVADAEANWQTAEVRVRHNEDVTAERLAEVLADIDYPAQSWNTTAAREVLKS